MKLRHLLASLALLFVFLSSHAAAQNHDFVVHNYDVDIQLHKKGYFDVTERYDIEFFQPRHGIIRDIITSYQFTDAQGQLDKRTLRISKVKVPKHKFKENNRIQRRQNKTHSIRIGHPKKTVTGAQHYEIRYRVHNAFLFEEDHVAFYWNVKPSMWDAPFEQVNFRIHAPKGVDIAKDDTFVYAGYDDKEPSTAFDYTWDGSTFETTSHPDFTSTHGESVTALIRLPEDAIKDTSFHWPPWFKYLSFLFAPFMLIGYLFTWLRFGRQEKPLKVTTYYPPDNLDSCMAGYLLNSKADAMDVLSMIPKWGGEGKVKLEEIETKKFLRKRKDMVIRKLDVLPFEAPAYEHTIFNGLFVGESTEIVVSTLKDRFHTTLEYARKQLHDASQVYYDQTAEKVRVATMIGAGAIGALLAWFSFTFFGGAQAIAVGAASALVIALNQTLRRRNERGQEVLGELQGFREFVKLADSDRIAMLIEEDPNYFEKTVSYAMAFGLLKQWAAKFDALNVPPPNWYSATGSAMTMNSFAQSFDTNMASAKTAMVSSPSSSSSGGSSGGGSAGGGFGGGGGRSW